MHAKKIVLVLVSSLFLASTALAEEKPESDRVKSTMEISESEPMCLNELSEEADTRKPNYLERIFKELHDQQFEQRCSVRNDPQRLLRLMQGRRYYLLYWLGLVDLKTTTLQHQSTSSDMCEE